MKGTRIVGNLYAIYITGNEVNVKDLIEFARSRDVRSATVADGVVYLEYYASTGGWSTRAL